MSNLSAESSAVASKAKIFLQASKRTTQEAARSRLAVNAGSEAGKGKALEGFDLKSGTWGITSEGCKIIRRDKVQTHEVTSSRLFGNEPVLCRAIEHSPSESPSQPLFGLFHNSVGVHPVFLECNFSDSFELVWNYLIKCLSDLESNSLAASDLDKAFLVKVFSEPLLGDAIEDSVRCLYYRMRQEIVCLSSLLVHDLDITLSKQEYFLLDEKRKKCNERAIFYSRTAFERQDVEKWFVFDRPLEGEILIKRFKPLGQIIEELCTIECTSISQPLPIPGVKAKVNVFYSLFVKLPGGRTRCLRVEGSMKGWYIKSQIENLEGIRTGNFWLKHNGKVVNNHEMLSEQSIVHNSTVEVQLTVLGGSGRNSPVTPKLKMREIPEEEEEADMVFQKIKKDNEDKPVKVRSLKKEIVNVSKSRLIADIILTPLAATCFWAGVDVGDWELSTLSEALEILEPLWADAKAVTLATMAHNELTGKGVLLFNSLNPVWLTPEPIDVYAYFEANKNALEVLLQLQTANPAPTIFVTHKGYAPLLNAKEIPLRHFLIKNFSGSTRSYSGELVEKIKSLKLRLSLSEGCKVEDFFLKGEKVLKDNDDVSEIQENSTIFMCLRTLGGTKGQKKQSVDAEKELEKVELYTGSKVPPTLKKGIKEMVDKKKKSFNEKKVDKIVKKEVKKTAPREKAVSDLAITNKIVVSDYSKLFKTVSCPGEGPVSRYAGLNGTFPTVVASPWERPDFNWPNVSDYGDPSVQVFVVQRNPLAYRIMRIDRCPKFSYRAQGSENTTLGTSFEAKAPTEQWQIQFFKENEEHWLKVPYFLSDPVQPGKPHGDVLYTTRSRAQPLGRFFWKDTSSSVGVNVLASATGQVFTVNVYRFTLGTVNKVATYVSPSMTIGASWDQAMNTSLGSGYYAFSLSMASQGTVSIKMQVYNFNATDFTVWGHRCIPQLEHKSQLVEGIRMLGVSTKVTPSGPILNRGGYIQAIQLAIGQQWEEYVYGSDKYSEVSEMANGSGNWDAPKGLYGFMKPVDIDDWEFKEPFVTGKDGITDVTMYFEDVRSPMIFMLNCVNEAERSFVLEFKLALEYQSNDSWLQYSTKTPSPQACEAARIDLSNFQQWHENPLHMADILKFVKEKGGRLLALAKEYGPSVAKAAEIALTAL